MYKFKNYTHTAFSSPLVRLFIAIGLSNYSVLSSSSTLYLFSCSNTLLIEVGINVNWSKVAAKCPSRSTLNNIPSENAINRLGLIRKYMKGKKKFMSCNRVNKEIHNTIKIVAFWFTNRVCTGLLNFDTTTDNNANIDLRINHSLYKLDKLAEDSIEKVLMPRLSADTSSGGTWKGLL